MPFVSALWAILGPIRALPWWVWVVAALVGWGWWGHHAEKVAVARLASAQVDAAKVQAAIASQAAADAQALRLREAAAIAAKENASALLDEEKRSNERRVAAARSGTELLRSQLRDYAAGTVPAGAASQPDTACRDRAAALGSVLGTVLQGYAACTSDLEDQASGVRALLYAWPR